MAPGGYHFIQFQPDNELEDPSPHDQLPMWEDSNGKTYNIVYVQGSNSTTLHSKERSADTIEDMIALLRILLLNGSLSEYQLEARNTAKSEVRSLCPWTSTNVEYDIDIIRIAGLARLFSLGSKCMGLTPPEPDMDYGDFLDRFTFNIHHFKEYHIREQVGQSSNL